ncbi:MAG: response regulator transcription factor [Ignavibacteriales bacterium]|nr:response regulator transcription factor [Ignavibacteriales bacterium]
MKILLVEDNKILAQDIKHYLKESGFLVEWVENLKSANEKIALYNYDIAIVDLGLPDGNGLSLIKKIKDNNIEIGVLILTARDSIDDKVKGLNVGADDYMTKPFHNAELIARLHSIQRRKSDTRNNIIQVDEIKIDTLNFDVYVKNEKLKLTKKEFDLLLYFMHNPKKILTRESIAEYLWGDQIDQADNFDFVYNHIKNLRKKIIDACGKSYIKAMYGMGYKFLSED